MNDHSEHTDHEHSSGHGKSYDNDHPEPRQFLLPGIMIMQIDHPLDVDQCKLPDLINPHLKSLGDQLKDKLGDRLIVKQDLFRRVQTQNLLTFPRQDDQRSPFSLVRVELNTNKQEHLIAVLTEIYAELKTREGHFELGEPDQGVIWRAVSPNWLLSSAGHGKPHPPSPGSWPLAKSSPTELDWKFSLYEHSTSKRRDWPPEFTNDGANVHVAILDTAPCGTDLDEAYATWHDRNMLIDQLLRPGPDPQLRLVTDFYAEIELLDCSLARHRYWMADHGLFIAGEIVSIAPESKLHLYKVFTSYGSASTFTIAQGLLRILTDLTDGTVETPLIVNCSFGLAVPVPGYDDFDFPADLRNSPGKPDIEEHMQTSLRELFDELTNRPGVILVAAAGDDSDTSKPDTPRAPARFPAAYERVIGVGALPRASKPKKGLFPTASYSNLADNPPSQGYVTLGGEPGPGNGVLGIFASEIPEFHPMPEDGWKGPGHLPPDPKDPARDRLGYKAKPNDPTECAGAHWAGASFAAPIITGILANWCSQQLSKGLPITLEDARAALDNLSQGLTAEGERVILVTQG